MLFSQPKPLTKLNIKALARDLPKPRVKVALEISLTRMEAQGG
jgi:hypothetical protein